MTEPSEILFHIGDGKAGSTFIQAAMRINRDSMLPDVDYVLPSDAEYSVPEHVITSGFGSGFFADTGVVDRLLTSGRLRAPGRYLLSSERMLEEIDQCEAFESVVARLRAASLEPRFLVIIRDPVDHAASVWQQGVKRHAVTKTVGEMFGTYACPERVARVLEAVEVVGADLTVLNYGLHRQTLLADVAGWAGIDPVRLIPPSMSVVNRSLTRGEIELQRLLNGTVRRPCGDLLADRFAEELPGIPAEHSFPAVEVQHAMLDRLRPSLERVNRVAGEEGYRLHVRPATPCDDRYVFSGAELTLMARLIAELELQARSANLLTRVLSRAGRRAHGALDRYRHRATRDHQIAHGRQPGP